MLVAIPRALTPALEHGNLFKTSFDTFQRVYEKPEYIYVCFSSDGGHGLILQTVKADSHTGFPLDATTMLSIKAEKLA